jgi:hypothetical protein
MPQRFTFKSCNFDAKMNAIFDVPKSADIQVNMEDTKIGNQVKKFANIRDDEPAAPQAAPPTMRSWRGLIDTAVLTVLCGVTILLIAHFTPVLQSPPNPPPVVNVTVPQAPSAVSYPQVRMRFHFKDATANSAKTVISSEGVPFDVDSERSQFTTQGNTFELKQPQK